MVHLFFFSASSKASHTEDRTVNNNASKDKYQLIDLILHLVIST